VKKVHRQDPGGLRVQELPPGRTVPARRRVDACCAEDLADGGRRDRNPELGQLAVNTPVAPERVFFARRMVNRAMLRTVGGRPGRRRLLVSYFLAASLRCQASRVAGVTGKLPPSAAAG
jgi:hypothetical protein